MSPTVNATHSTSSRNSNSSHLRVNNHDDSDNCTRSNKPNHRSSVPSVTTRHQPELSATERREKKRELPYSARDERHPLIRETPQKNHSRDIFSDPTRELNGDVTCGINSCSSSECSSSCSTSNNGDNGDSNNIKAGNNLTYYAEEDSECDQNGDNNSDGVNGDNSVSDIASVLTLTNRGKINKHPDFSGLNITNNSYVPENDGSWFLGDCAISHPENEEKKDAVRKLSALRIVSENDFNSSRVHLEKNDVDFDDLRFEKRYSRIISNTSKKDGIVSQFRNSKHTNGQVLAKSETAIKSVITVPSVPENSSSDMDINNPTPVSLVETIDEPPEAAPRKSKHTEDPNHVSHQFFKIEPCLYTHRMFVRAARIFSVLKHDDADTEEKKALRRRNGTVSAKEKIPDMDFLDAHEQIKTFELTFATLKFQRVFSIILDFVGFFGKYSNLNIHYSLVYVILYDLQTRKFQKRLPFPGEELDKTCAEVEEALHVEKTKLLATFAKERIKHNAPSVDFLLPEHVRNKDETKAKTPVYMWVNQMKATMESVVTQLKDRGYVPVEPGTEMSDVTEHAFLVDAHCSDLLTFPPHLSMELKASDLVKDGLLVQQDKSSCIAPQTVTHLLGHDLDVIHVNVGTGTTSCHLASLLRHNSPHSHIWAFGVENPQKSSKIMKTMEFLECRNTIRIVHENFLNVDPEDSKFKSVRVIFISANCSKSAITSPVQFIVSEGEDTQILGELSVGEADMNHVRDLTTDHERLLKHALKFPKMQAIVYSTRSRFELENEQVIEKVLDHINASSLKRSPFQVAPPVLAFSADEINSERGGVDGRYIRFLPTDKANGCFVAIIAREPEESKDAGRPGGKNKSKSSLSKSKSVQSNNSTRKHRKSVKGGASLPDISATSPEGDGELSPTEDRASSPSRGKSKTAHHKAPAAIGARLYQKRLLAKMETRSKEQHKPEHTKVLNHPAPFRESSMTEV